LRCTSGPGTVQDWQAAGRLRQRWIPLPARGKYSFSVTSINLSTTPSSTSRKNIKKLHRNPLRDRDAFVLKNRAFPRAGAAAGSILTTLCAHKHFFHLAFRKGHLEELLKDASLIFLMESTLHPFL
jgi:hypothetical protein